MVEIVWTREALAQLELIRRYIHQFDEHAAKKIASRLAEAANRLTDFPDRGRPTSRGFRELPTVAPYVIRYRRDNTIILILSIRHGRQRR